QIGAYRTDDEGGGGGTILATAAVVHPAGATPNGDPIAILDGLDYGKLMADPNFPHSQYFIENTASCQWRQLHEALLGIPMAGAVVGWAFELDENPTVDALKAATGFPQYFISDFLAEFSASDYFMQVGPPN